MALSNTYDTTNPGSAVSNREDLSDVLTILAPEETPVLSSLPKTRASGTFHEWTVDSLSSPTTAGIAEGADVTTFTDQFSGRARLGNYTQKFRRDFMVSDLQEAVDSVGPAKIAQAEAKAVRELKRDVEATLLSANDRAVEDGAGTVYKLRGLGDWIDSSGPADVPSSFRTPADSIHATGAFTETSMNNIITSIYRVSGTTNSLTLVADTALRRIISDFARLDPDGSGAGTSIRNVNYNGDVAQIKLSVELYQSDHGIVSVVNMNPDCAPDTSNKDTGYFVNPEYAGIGELIPMGSSRLPNQGGGERGFVDCALTLAVYHPGAHGKITAIA
jgi:hypothetical protein|tara:strand:+ start:1833 stop:2825 length:993 start_codon:yes stop_codon:yes gene_type:complete